MSLRVYLALLLLAVLWGSAFPMIKVGLEDIGVLHLTLARHLVASLCFLPFLALTRSRLRPAARDVPAFVGIGAVGFTIYHVALNAGELRVSAGATSLIIASAPAITALLARLLLGERLPAAGWAGSLIAFSGIALIAVGDGAALGFDPYSLLVLLAAFCAALFFVLQKPLFARYRAVEVTAFATWGGTLPMLLFLPGFAGDLASAGADALLATVYIGIFPSAVAYTLSAFALSQAPVTLVSAYLYTIPIFSLLFSWLMLGEVPGLLTALGGAVAIGGIVLVNLAKQGAARRAQAQASRA